MSFVGPRPERPEFVEQLSERVSYYNERHRVKPGITGWAQLHYIYSDSIDGGLTKLQYDLYRSEEHTSELQSLMRISYAVFCLKKKTKSNSTVQYVRSTTIIQR